MEDRGEWSHRTEEPHRALRIFLHVGSPLSWKRSYFHLTWHQHHSLGRTARDLNQQDQGCPSCPSKPLPMEPQPRDPARPVASLGNPWWWHYHGPRKGWKPAAPGRSAPEGLLRAALQGQCPAHSTGGASTSDPQWASQGWLLQTEFHRREVLHDPKTLCDIANPGGKEPLISRHVFIRLDL